MSSETVHERLSNACMRQMASALYARFLFIGARQPIRTSALEESIRMALSVLPTNSPVGFHLRFMTVLTGPNTWLN